MTNEHKDCPICALAERIKAECKAKRAGEDTTPGNAIGHADVSTPGTSVPPSPNTIPVAEMPEGTRFEWNFGDKSDNWCECKIEGKTVRENALLNRANWGSISDMFWKNPSRIRNVVLPAAQAAPASHGGDSAVQAEDGETVCLHCQGKGKIKTVASVRDALRAAAEAFGGDEEPSQSSTPSGGEFEGWKAWKSRTNTQWFSIQTPSGDYFKLSATGLPWNKCDPTPEKYVFELHGADKAAVVRDYLAWREKQALAPSTPAPSTTPVCNCTEHKFIGYTDTRSGKNYRTMPCVSLPDQKFFVPFVDRTGCPIHDVMPQSRTLTAGVSAPSNEPDYCPDCNSINTKRRTVTENFKYGDKPDSPILHAMVLEHHCNACGLTWTASDAEDARQEAIDAHLKSLNAPSTNADLEEVANPHNLDLHDLAMGIQKYVIGRGFANLERYLRGYLGPELDELSRRHVTRPLWSKARELALELVSRVHTHIDESQTMYKVAVQLKDALSTEPSPSDELADLRKQLDAAWRDLASTREALGKAQNERNAAEEALKQHIREHADLMVHVRKLAEAAKTWGSNESLTGFLNRHAKNGETTSLQVFANLASPILSHLKPAEPKKLREREVVKAERTDAGIEFLKAPHGSPAESAAARRIADLNDELAAIDAAKGGGK